jgi:hypothetical protein
MPLPPIIILAGIMCSTAVVLAILAMAHTRQADVPRHRPLHRSRCSLVG